MEEKEKFFRKMNELYEFTEKELESCPWIKDLSVEKIVEEVKKELEEVEGEIKKKNEKDLAKETGDVFRDVFLLLFIVSRKTGTQKDKILSYVLKKVRWRKPWIEKGGKVSKKEAVKIWHEKKEKENIEL